MPIKKQRVIQKSKTEEKLKKYLELKSQVESISEVMEKLKAELKQRVGDKGYESPQGHKLLTVTVDDVPYTLKNTLRVTPYLKPDAIDVIKAKLPEQAKSLIEKTEVVRQDRLKSMIENGKINARTAKQLFGTKENFAFGVTETKEGGEDEEC